MPDEPTGGRYRITFQLCPLDRGTATYTVATLLSRDKALCIAVMAHAADKGVSIFEVIEVEYLGPPKARDKDLGDRMKW